MKLQTHTKKKKKGNKKEREQKRKKGNFAWFKIVLYAQNLTGLNISFMFISIVFHYVTDLNFNKCMLSHHRNTMLVKKYDAQFGHFSYYGHYFVF